MLTTQEALARLTGYWAAQSCRTSPDGRQATIESPSADPHELYLGSLTALGINITAHDVQLHATSPTSWAVRLDGREITSADRFPGGSTQIRYGLEQLIAVLRVTGQTGYELPRPDDDGVRNIPAAPAGTDPRMLAFEVGTDELTPAAGRAARDDLRRALSAELATAGCTATDLRVFGTARRLIAIVPAAGPTAEVLTRALERVVATLECGPIRWLTALWGDAVLPVSVGATTADRFTRPLRTAPASAGLLRVASAGAFMEVLALAGVVADPEDRYDLVVTGAADLGYPDGRIDVAAAKLLIDELTHRTEAPTPLLGTFDEEFLALPATTLTTVLRDEHHYLPLHDADGRLLPMFVHIADGPIDVTLARAGHEATLRDRLTEAAQPLP